MRPMTSKQLYALHSGIPDYAFLELDHPDDYIRAWSGSRPLIQYLPNGERRLWHGAGQVIEIRGLEQNRDFEVTEVEMIFSGIDNAVVSDISLDVSDRFAAIHLGFVGKDRRIIDGLITIDVMTMDRAELDMGADTSRFIIYATSGLTNLDKPSREVMSTEFQKSRFPNVEDTGFSQLPELQNFESMTKWSPGTYRSA